jgi:D-beta-D-heptose 7-phosphate kinase/D-beta-D-heptose 1-phosphate adenosyltransferase
MAAYDTVAVSGGMDPVHKGHVRMIQEAAQFGDVIVILNSDDWLMRKKGFVFMSWEERAEILESIKGVTKVVRVDDTDGSVCEALRREKPTYFANGGDRTDKNTPEMDVCTELGITMLWGVGGGKIQSSSDLVAKIRK